MPAPARPEADRRRRGLARQVGDTLALVALGTLTALLGTSIHLARGDVAGTLLPWGVVLAVALVAATDVAVAAASLHLPRPRPGRALLSVGAGRALVLGLLLLPTAEGDLVLTGLPASTAWILLAVVLPAFAAPMTTALAVAGPRTRSGSSRSPVAVGR